MSFARVITKPEIEKPNTVSCVPVSALPLIPEYPWMVSLVMVLGLCRSTVRYELSVLMVPVDAQVSLFIKQANMYIVEVQVKSRSL